LSFKPLDGGSAGWPVLGNPANRNRAIPLTYEQFRFGFANAVSEEEARELYETFAVPVGRAALPGRGHALTIDSGWREVADWALAFVRRFV
jgi:hypothetical protein